MKSFLPTLLLALVVLLTGCSLLPDTDQARIIFGESIEGIHIGDDSSRVVQKLGPPPHQAYPDLDGWIFIYDESPLVLTEISIARKGGVLTVSIYPPYSGTTEEGIGIGTSRSEALETFGQPDSSQEIAQGIRDAYFFEDVGFVIEYRDQAIYSIRMIR